MIMTKVVTVSEIQNNFDKYLDLVMKGQQIVVTKNGKEIGRFVPKNTTISYLTDTLTGILKDNYDLDDEKIKRLNEKYGIGN